MTLSHVVRFARRGWFVWSVVRYEVVGEIGEKDFVEEVGVEVVRVSISEVCGLLGGDL
jgi:hypothetical protein